MPHSANSLLLLIACFVTSTTQAVLPVPSSRLQRRGVNEYSISTQRFCTLFHYQMGGYVKVEKGRKVLLNTMSPTDNLLVFKSVDVGKVTIQDPVTKHYICLGHRHITAKAKLRKSRCVFTEEHMQYLDAFYIPIVRKLDDGRQVTRKHYLTFKKGKGGKVRGAVGKGNKATDLKRQFIRVCRDSGRNDDSEKRFRHLFNKIEVRENLDSSVITVEKSKKRRHKKGKKGGSKKDKKSGDKPGRDGEHGRRKHDRTKVGSS